MSYVKVKNISMNKKSGVINICGASNNVSPITYYTWNIVKDIKDYHKEELELLRGLNGGGLVLNNSCYKWQYAIEKTNIEFYASANTWKLYEDTSMKYDIYCVGEKISNRYILINEEDLKSGLYEEDYKGETYTLYRNKEQYKKEQERVNNILEHYYNVFMKYFNEKHNGKYYLYTDDYGVIIPKGTNGAFYYNVGRIEGMDYFKAYCLKETCERGRNITIKIREVQEKEYQYTKEQKEEEKERLNILGVENNVDEFNDIIIEQEIYKFEKEHKCLVYYISRNYANFGELYNMFYVSNYSNEWQEDKEQLKNNESYCYVFNKTDEMCSEIGLIGFEKEQLYNGNYRLKRVF